jgi:subtilisin family serine protease
MKKHFRGPVPLRGSQKAKGKRQKFLLARILLSCSWLPYLHPVVLVWSLAALGLIVPVLTLAAAIGEDGINAAILRQPPYNLLGRKIAIGQVEIGRPGKFGLDKAVSKNPLYNLAGLFYRDDSATANNNVDNHAAMVASVILSRDKGFPGVAPEARLYSSAIGALKKGGQAEECLSSQHIALQNSGDVRAINFSFGESLQRDGRENAVLDGNALLTLCIDWSARVHDVLYVVSGNQGGGGISIPTDQYNGITAAYTAKRQGKFSKVDFANLSSQPVGIGRNLIKREINQGPRRAVSLLAPGDKISVYNLQGEKTEASGTSFAAPHITGSVALLQEAGDARGRAQGHRHLLRADLHGRTDSRRHEVMKAVLLNSADKIEDTGDGLLLGMSRTVLTKNNRTWIESDAYKDDKIPLDLQMGTGHLNVFRAYQQLNAGQWKSNNGIPVANLGWDYDTVNANSYRDYILEKPLQKGSFASITLTWDRLVELKDENENQQYDVGESFSDRGLNNLDLYLVSLDNNQSYTCSSVSEVDSIEHIFCPIPATGNYKIRVQYIKQKNQKSQAYSLAWWTLGK